MNELVNDAIYYITTLSADEVLNCLTVGLLGAGIFTWHSSNKAQKDRQIEFESTTRPYIYVEVKPNLDDPKNTYLYITNLGQSGAKNLSFSFPDKEPIRFGETWKNIGRDVPIFPQIEPQQVIPPRWEYKNILGTKPQTDIENSKPFYVTVSYNSISSNKEYKEMFLVNPNTYSNYISVGRTLKEDNFAAVIATISGAIDENSKAIIKLKPKEKNDFVPKIIFYANYKNINIKKFDKNQKKNTLNK
jgi:hypothetical protein